MKFRPLHNRVVIERIDAEAKTAGGIIIPDTAQEKPQQGKVIAVGPGGRDESGKLIPIDVKAGDRVLFGKWSGTEVKTLDMPDPAGVSVVASCLTAGSLESQLCRPGDINLRLAECEDARNLAGPKAES